MSYIISNCKGNLSLTILDSKNRELLDMDKRKYKEFVEEQARQYEAATNKEYTNFRKEALLHYIKDHCKLTKWLYQCIYEKRSLLSIYMHSYYYKLLCVHTNLIMKLSYEVGMTNSIFECHKLASLTKLKQLVLKHKNRQSLLSIMKEFILYCHPYKLGTQIEGYCKELSKYVSKKDKEIEHRLYEIGAYILQDIKYDIKDDQTYYLNKHKELCCRH